MKIGQNQFLLKLETPGACILKKMGIITLCMLLNGIFLRNLIKKQMNNKNVYHILVHVYGHTLFTSCFFCELVNKKIVWGLSNEHS